MALSASDQALVDQIAQGLQGASNIPWSTLLGLTTLSTPAAGMATLPAEQAAGVLTNAPFAGMNTLDAQQALGYIQPGPTANLNNPDIGRVLPIQQLGQETLQNKQLQQNAADQSGYIVGDGTQYHVPGYDAGGGSDVLTVGQMRQGLADWVPNTTLQALSPDQVAAAWAQLTGNQQPVLIPGSGQATLANQENFAQQFGRQGSFGAAGDTGNPYTLTAQQATGYIGGNGLGENGGGAATTQEQQLQQQGGLGVLNLLSQLSGPANAFQQQAVLNGLDSTGLSKSVGAIQGKYGLPTFQAPQANPQAQTLQSLMNQVSAGTNTPGLNGGFTGSGGSSTPVYPGGSAGGTLAGTNGAGAPSTMDSGTAAYLNALPAPNKINARNFYNLDPDSQKFILSAYGAAGYSPSSVLNTTEKLLPTFKAPAAGSIAA